MALYLSNFKMPKTGRYFAMIDGNDQIHDDCVVTIWRRLENGNFESIGFSPIQEVHDIVFCKDCIHRPLDKERPDQKDYGIDVEFPLLDDECPYHCGDPYYNERPKDNWFCHKGEKANGER